MWSVRCASHWRCRCTRKVGSTYPCTAGKGCDAQATMTACTAQSYLDSWKLVESALVGRPSCMFASSASARWYLR